MNNMDIVDTTDLMEVCCDVCGAVLGVVSEEQFDEVLENLWFCNLGGCNIHNAGATVLRRVGMTIRAAQIERQWVIDRSLCDYGEVFEAREAGDGVPF